MRYFWPRKPWARILIFFVPRSWPFEEHNIFLKHSFWKTWKTLIHCTEPQSIFPPNVFEQCFFFSLMISLSNFAANIGRKEGKSSTDHSTCALMISLTQVVWIRHTSQVVSVSLPSSVLVLVWSLCSIWDDLRQFCTVGCTWLPMWPCRCSLVLLYPLLWSPHPNQCQGTD